MYRHANSWNVRRIISHLEIEEECHAKSDPLLRDPDFPNAALVLVDHQVGLVTGVRDYSMGELKHSVVPVTEAAKWLEPPIMVTTTAHDSMRGPTFSDLVEALPGI